MNDLSRPSLNVIGIIDKSPIASSVAWVKDKSYAVSSVLGYGVDSEGFFTSDFNDKAKIAKSFKIHSKQIKDLYSTYTDYIPAYNSIDIAQTAGNAYKALERDMAKHLKQNYTQEEFANLTHSNNHLNTKFNNIISLQKEFDERGINIEKVDFAGFLSPNLLTHYTQNGMIDKTAFLAMYIDSNFIEGEVNMYGKIMGFDKSINKVELENLQNFINDNKIFGLFGVGANLSDFKELTHSTHLSIDEFKQKYLEFKEKVEKEQSWFQSLPQNEMQEYSNPTKQDENLKRTPIQVVSKSQTYKDLNYSIIQNLLKDKQKLEFFDILFSQNTSKTNKSIDLNLNQIKTLNTLDIKA